MKGILLAGGTGSRLFPLTHAVSKQLLPVYDKPLVYYPLSTLMLAGIRDVLVITRRDQTDAFERLLGDGHQWGMQFTYAVQEEPNGIAEALIIGEEFLAESPSALILGDNVFYGQGLGGALQELPSDSNARILAYEVADPTPYAVVEVDDSFQALGLEEKPKEPKTTLAVPGLYFLPSDAPTVARGIRRGERGELEITDVNKAYLHRDRLQVIPLPRGTVWMDAGTFAGLHDAASFVRVMEERTGARVACPEEIAWRQGWISDIELGHLAQECLASGYGTYLLALLDRGFGLR